MMAAPVKTNDPVDDLGLTEVKKAFKRPSRSWHGCATYYICTVETKINESKKSLQSGFLEAKNHESITKKKRIIGNVRHRRLPSTKILAHKIRLRPSYKT